jgi:enoyl-CoA hydratase/carnithine racemase
LKSNFKILGSLYVYRIATILQISAFKNKKVQRSQWEHREKHWSLRIVLVDTMRRLYFPHPHQLFRQCRHFAAGQRSLFGGSSKNGTPPSGKQSGADRVTTTIDTATGIAHVVLNRPEKLNALDLAMFEAISETAINLQADRSIRAVILSGNGRAFCTGLDIQSAMPDFKSSLGLSSSSGKSWSQRLLERPEGQVANLAQDVGYRWRELNVPVIAALHGMCFGGGMQIALGADFRFATPDCKISIMEAKWGLIPDMSATVTLRELVRIDVAKELTMTAKTLTGVEAAELGLVTRVTDDPLQEAKDFAKRIVERSPDSISLSKKLYQSTWVAVPEDYCLTVETELQKQLLGSWNQIAAAGRSFGWKIPYFKRKS